MDENLNLFPAMLMFLHVSFVQERDGKVERVETVTIVLDNGPEILV